MIKRTLNALDRQLCAEISVSFFVNLDRGEYDQVIDCLTDDIQWNRRGQKFIGHAAVLAVLKARSPSIISRHVITNIATKATGETEVENYFTVLTFQSDEPENHAGPRKISGPTAMLTSTDKLVRVGDCWKIFQKDSEVTFLIE